MSHIPEAVAESQPLDAQALDIQHDTDPAEDHGPARRIPHLGHAALFFSIAAFFIFLCLSLGVAIVSSVLHISTEAVVKDHQLSLLAAQALAYILTLLISAWLFPRLWHRSFLHGIQWNVLAAHRRWYWIVPGAVLLSAAAQGATHFIPQPGKLPIEELMSTPHAAWLTMAFGVLLAPLTEEIAFRGFLLPALATAYDWLALERTPAALQKWENSSMHSTPAVVFAAIFSSVPFALLHAGQIAHAWGIVGVLYGVSLTLSYVRVRTHSVACSALMHATYNFSIFAVIYVYTDGFHHLERLMR
jgi:membrane protease YdiL (CAAX protease family)